MLIIANELKTIAAQLDLIYVRAINFNDLNQVLQNIKVDKPVLVYANLAPIDFQEVISSFEIAEIETSIYVLNKHLSADPTAEQIDELLAPLYIQINYVYDLLTRSDIIPEAADVLRKSLRSNENIQLTDENLGGYEMILTVPIARELYNCD